MSHSELIACLPPLSRLALAYAPASVRSVWLGALALDVRLGQVVREAREPLIGQIRLAWWRERLTEDSAAWPAGEPLLALLKTWQGGHTVLAPVVDGWEALLGEPPLGKEALLDVVQGRAQGLVGAAIQLGHADRAEGVARMAQRWAIADLAANLTNLEERAVLADLAAIDASRPGPLPRALRPVVVLGGASQGRQSGPAALLRAMRLGIFGR